MATTPTTPRLPSTTLIRVFIVLFMSSPKDFSHCSLKFVYRTQREIHAERALCQRAILFSRADDVSEPEACHETPVLCHRIDAGCGHPDRAETRFGRVRGQEIS